jgi:hypothetical protein
VCACQILLWSPPENHNGFCRLNQPHSGNRRSTVLGSSRNNRKAEVSLEDCVGLGVDTTNSMVGAKNSLFSRLKKVSPDCVLFKCSCHSLALCVEHAFEKMPLRLGQILTEIPSWFSNSTICRDEYKKLFEALDQNEEHSITPLPFQKLSSTRWLCRSKVIWSLLQNWKQLTNYFPLIEPEVEYGQRWKVWEFFHMSNNRFNFMYLTMVQPIINDFERVNAFLQHTNADPEKVVSELFLLHSTIRERIFFNDSVRPVSTVDFGAKFWMEHDKHLWASNFSKEATTEIEEMKTHCLSFLIEAEAQLRNRLLEYRSVSKGLTDLSPHKDLSQINRVMFSNLPFLHLIPNEKFSVVENQYRMIRQVIWIEEQTFNGSIPQDTEEFWCKIFNHRNDLSDAPFSKLALYALSALTVPI